jgi:hypothetical protein
MLPIILAVLTAAAQPSPSPTPLLKTIVTVKSSALCGEFAAHTNAAIGSAIQNDQALGTTILTLKSRDLAGSSLDRVAELHRLDALASSIYKQYRAGEDEVSALRALAAKTTDPQEKAELEASADALGGALYRQHLMQRDLDGFVAFLNASDMMTDDQQGTGNPGDQRHTMAEDLPGATPEGAAGFWLPQTQAAFYHRPLLAGQESPEDDVTMARAASEDFQSRLPALMLDEMTAAGHIETAAQGC